MKTPLSRDALQAVRQVPLFTGLEDDTLALLTGGALERSYRRGTLLFSEGEPADRFYVVLDGWVKLFRESPDGNECMVGLFTRGSPLPRRPCSTDSVSRCMPRWPRMPGC